MGIFGNFMNNLSEEMKLHQERMRMEMDQMRRGGTPANLNNLALMRAQQRAQAEAMQRMMDQKEINPDAMSDAPTPKHKVSSKKVHSPKKPSAKAPVSSHPSFNADPFAEPGAPGSAAMNSAYNSISDPDLVSLARIQQETQLEAARTASSMVKKLVIIFLVFGLLLIGGIFAFGSYSCNKMQDMRNESHKAHERMLDKALFLL